MNSEDQEKHIELKKNLTSRKEDVQVAILNRHDPLNIFHLGERS